MPVTHGETTHVKTCPDGAESSLLVAITRARSEAGVGLKHAAAAGGDAAASGGRLGVGDGDHDEL